MIRNNKKGNYPDIISMIEFSIAMVITLLVVLIFIGDLNTNVASMNETIVPNQIKLALSEYNDAVSGYGDILFVSIIIVFFIFSVSAARLIPSSSKFYPISFFAIILYPIAGMVVENIWEGFANNAILQNKIAGLVFIPFIMDHMLFVCLFYSTGIAIALLSKEGKE